jgi:CRP/FNR family transcriptional regulator, cyclic AMP receptor protein
MIMPSAQHVELDEPAGLPATEDLYSLLHAIQASNISNLNSLHGRGKVLFAEGEPARGVYILRTGRATISISSSEGRIVIPRIAQAGDALGLNSVLRSSSYDATVKTLEPCRTDFIPRAELLELVEKSHAGAHAVLKILSHELTELTERTNSLLLPQTASARLAKLLLEWSRKSVRIDRVFTHEELAQMIGSSRETVTRLLASISRRKIIQITSDSIRIRDDEALEKMALS